MYARAFQRVLQSAVESSLPVALRTFVVMCVPCETEAESRFGRARELLEMAAREIDRPEVLLHLACAAVAEARIAVGGPKLGASWLHLMNLFGQGGLNLTGLRRQLPQIMQYERNYASHYENPGEPNPHVLDGVVYLLAAAQFLADLQAIVENGSITLPAREQRFQTLATLSRIVKQLDSIMSFDREFLEVAERLEMCSGEELLSILKRKCATLLGVGLSPFRELDIGKPGVPRGSVAFSNGLATWFGKDEASLPEIDWDDGRGVAPQILHVCRFLLLERVQLTQAARAGA